MVRQPRAWRLVSDQPAPLMRVRSLWTRIFGADTENGELAEESVQAAGLCLKEYRNEITFDICGVQRLPAYAGRQCEFAADSARSTTAGRTGDPAAGREHVRSIQHGHFVWRHARHA
jgi:hypothetical protein